MNYSKYILLLLLFSITYFNGFCQGEVDPKNMVGYGCYSSGEQSESVKKISNLIKLKSYNKISKLLTSNFSSERYLAAISLEYLDSLEIYKIDSFALDKIKDIKESKDQVSYCSGCMLFINRYLFELFEPEYISQAKNWLNYELTKK